MLSLFCETLCVLAQLINSAAQPAAIPLRKKVVVDFIDGDLPCYRGIKAKGRRKIKK
jgi:hypothetical protein